MSIEDDLPDVRDGFNRKERAVLYCLARAREELGREFIPTALLYGRVLEIVDMSEGEFQEILGRMVNHEQHS